MEFLQANIMWVAAAAVSGGMLLWQAINTRGGGDSVSPAEATQLMNRENAVVVDVRDAGEVKEGRIPNARHIVLGELGQRLGELEKFKDKPVIVCCRSGSRSANGAAVLRKAGFSRVYNLAGGLAAWEQAGQPITRK